MRVLKALLWAVGLVLTSPVARADDVSTPDNLAPAASPSSVASPTPASTPSPATAAPAASPSPAAVSPTPAASSAPVVAPTPATASAIPTSLEIKVSVGDSWTYDVRDGVTGDARETIVFEVTRIADGNIETRVSQSKRSTGAETTNIEVFDARWRLKDNGKVIFRPYSGLVGAPEDLQIGKTWPINFHAARKGAASTQDIAGAGKLEAWEHVTLPSGVAYDAFKIDLRTAMTLPGGRKRENHSVQWFAPAVNRVVKRIDENRENGKLRDASEQTLRAYKPAAKT
jgi:hypothetical protein